MPTEPDKEPRVCDYEGSDYQTRFWEQGGRAYEDQVEAIALKRLLPPSGKLMLEVGAGAGRNTPRYQGFERVVLMDYSLTQLQQAQAGLGRGERYIYVAADVYRLPFMPGLFDAATMIRVLHHMEDAPRALAQIRAVLQQDAIFILEFANKQHLKAIFRYLFCRQSWSPFSHEPVEFIELNFDFHPKAVQQTLESLDFQIQRRLAVSYFRLRFLKRLVPLKLLVGLDALFQSTGSLFQFSPSIFVRARAVGRVSGTAGDAFFRCPECKAALPDRGDGYLACSGCGLNWGIEDGIYNFKEPIKSK
ncbi:MAG: class I SAM-dependent methyltransferase [Anaerolineales bacterium]|jgi:ubiquinone/menaquinone biosynthesis C-methylase UbiE